MVLYKNVFKFRCFQLASHIEVRAEAKVYVLEGAFVLEDDLKLIMPRVSYDSGGQCYRLTKPPPHLLRLAVKSIQSI